MTAERIDGTAIAARLRSRIASRAAEFTKREGRPPGLAVVLIGDDPASAVYVRNKAAKTREVGMASVEIRRPSRTGRAELLAILAELNGDPAIDGILVQLPLPAHLEAGEIIAAIDPSKDVDGLHPLNAGRLAQGGDGLVPCTPLGCLVLLESVRGRDLAGLHAVIIGRSILVGRPLGQLLLAADVTVTQAHSRTRALPALAREADVLIAAAGRPGLVTAEFVRPGASVIDVGTTRVERAGKAVLAGDVDFAGVSAVAGALTPVPGGVGPMTIACLLANTLQAALARTGAGCEPRLALALARG